MAHLTVALLGQFRLTNRGELVAGLESARLQSLFAYLLLHRTAPTLRHHLAFLYWPDSTESQALNNLRSLIHKLRHGLPDADSCLVTDSLTIWLDADVPIDLDVARFEAATGANATRPQLELAARLYAGDLLPACYDDWILPLRKALNERACAALSRLVDLLEKALEYEAAIGYANQLLRLDPLQETTYRTLMRLHALNGDRAAGLHVYHVCVSTLREELDVLPSKATYAQYERLLAEYPAEPAAVQLAGRLPLIGRQAQWLALHDAWRAAANGKPVCVAVTGEAGIGKSRLVEELTSAVSRQGYAAAVAHCYAAEGMAAYAPVIEWLQSRCLEQRLREVDALVLTEVGRLLPDLLRDHPDLPRPTPLTAGWQRQHLFDALTRLMLRREHPLLLVLEDAQWCDRTTLEWLHYLLHRDEQASLLVVMTARSEELYGDQHLHNLLRALRQTAHLTEIRLDPLTGEETAQLAREASGRRLEPEALALVIQESEGYPLFAVELARLLPAQASWTEFPPKSSFAGAASSPASPTFEGLPPRMNAILQSHLAQLSPSARDLAGLAAVIGRQFTFTVLAAAFGQDEDTLISNLDELWQRKIVRERGADAYDFSHGKLRDVAYGSLSAARRRSLHRRVARALAPTPAACPDGVAGVAATHYELAGDYALALPLYRRAAEAAARVYVHDDAIRLYQRAISLQQGLGPASRASMGPAGQDDGELSGMYERLARILHLLTRYDEARIAYEQALAHTSAGDGIARSRLVRAIGNTWREQYHYDEAMASYQSALVGLSQMRAGFDAGAGEPLLVDGDSAADPQAKAYWQEWIQIQLDMSLTQYWLNLVDALDAVNAELEAAVERYGSPGQRASYWQRKGMLAFRRNRSVSTDEILQWAQRSLDALYEDDDSAALPSGHFVMGFHLLWSGRAQDAAPWLRGALAKAMQSGDISLQARCLAYLAIAYRQLDMADLVQQSVEQCLAVASAAHMPEYMGTAHASWTWLAWRAGQWTAVDRHAHEAFAAWGQLPPDHASLPFQWTCLLPLIAMARQAVELDKAVAYVRRLLDPLQQRLPDELATAAGQAVQAWEQGDALQASRQLDLLIERARTHHYL